MTQRQGQGQSGQPRRGRQGKDGHLNKLCREGKHNEIAEFIQTCSDLPLRMTDRQGVFGYMPIHEAVSSGHSQVLRLLLEHDGNPNCRTNGGNTPLHLAATNGHIDCARVLLAKNANITIKDEFGKTPIQIAKSNSKHGIVKLLRSAGECIYVMYCSNYITWADPFG